MTTFAQVIGKCASVIIKGPAKLKLIYIEQTFFNMKAYVFPGQGAQFSGMGKDLYDQFDWAKELFAEADSILGFT